MALNPTFELADHIALPLGYSLIVIGAVFVAGSYYHLVIISILIIYLILQRIVHTYLGDYFGILMKERITGNHPPIPHPFVINPKRFLTT